jgi:5-(carboxyamino)imidazole ribonucleotide mutase
MKPLVGIIMGSDSDLPIMQDAANILRELGVESEVTIVSAHRTPDRLVAYAKGAATKGFKLIIAGAGGAAHLPGMTAAFTNLPVIGVPVMTKTMKGIDSLLSIAQMPPGVPVATVAVNGAKNAGLLAAQILALSDTTLQSKIAEYRQNMEGDVLAKAEKLEGMSYEEYMKDHE